MAFFLRSCLLILIPGLLASCAPASSNSAQYDSTVGMLADIRGMGVFSDQNLQTLITSAPSHALIIGSTPPYRLLLIDGRVAWARDVSAVERVQVTTTSDTAALTNKPLSNQGDDDFRWVSLSKGQSAYVIEATNERFSETPSHVRAQGRQIFLQGDDGPYYWPQLKLAGSDVTGWASATELLFKPAQVKQEDVYGLVQKPFIALVKDRNPLTGNETAAPFDFLDLTHAHPKRHTAHRPHWQAEQLLFPSTGHPTNISSVALASSGSCHMFFVSWRSKDTARFGYCTDAEAGPTPVLLGYSDPSQQGPLVLNILEVTGDDDREIDVAITKDYRGEKSIVVLGEHGTQRN